MNRPSKMSRSILLTCATLLLLPLVTDLSVMRAQDVDPSLYSMLSWRSIGPFRGGRSTAVAGAPSRTDEYWFGATGGGVWKTTDGGESWACVSDGFFETSSVGAVAVSLSDPDVVYVGMGETQIRGNTAHGDGVYKSVDSGESWTHMGLAETSTISRIRIHPDDPDIVYVAALGHIYGQNEERGVFRSTDGGATWEKILYVSDRAGAVDLSMDPGNPETIYAATWEAGRTPYSLNSGGPGSKLFKTTDGGDNWTDITRNPGLPEGLIGKIGVALSPVDPDRVWAIVEAADGGIFRSDDAGATWTMLNDDRRFRQRAWYYTRIYADTKDSETVYVLNTGFYKSTDGGERYTTIGVPHGDNHDLWINPDDPQMMINSNDGSANVTFDGGRTWSEQDIPTAQFYHVITDNHFPYRIYGAQQDNSTVRIASRTSGSGIGESDWESTAGGESGYIAIDPENPDIVYGGSYGGLLTRVDHRTGMSRNINAWPDNPMGHGAIDAALRFQWTFPIVFSPHDSDVLYTCSQFLLKSTNEGETWKKISPDLTRNDPTTLGPSGGDITHDNTAVEYYATIFTISESPIIPGLIWAGSDDGLVHVTRDGGASWKQITPAGMPEWGLCSMIEASPHDPATAWLAVDNHENDDYTPWAFVTHDYGKSWTKIVDGIPNTTFFRVIREDPVKKGLLYGGTETGVYVSFNGGHAWQPLQLNLPITPIHDLVVKEDDLIAATHGRSFWVLDDIT
ncbi:WD40/YVTN/BNR-like repeat-containing protein, partial [Candidatus Zixiibacteriota bacterium]